MENQGKYFKIPPGSLDTVYIPGRVEIIPPDISIEECRAMTGRENHSGAKYLRPITLVDGRADVYAVLDAFDVCCPARQHAIKKLLCAGLRGKGDELQDLREARDAVDRAVEMCEARVI